MLVSHPLQTTAVLRLCPRTRRSKRLRRHGRFPSCRSRFRRKNLSVYATAKGSPNLERSIQTFRKFKELVRKKETKYTFQELDAYDKEVQDLRFDGF